MIEVMFQKGSWEDCLIVMSAIVDRQRQGVSDEPAGHEDAPAVTWTTPKASYIY
jgi:hypothetical protein